MSASNHTEIRGTRKAAILGTLAGWLMKGWCATLRYQFEDRCGLPAWTPGVVVRHDHPGVWVRIPGGSEWFVTSGKRIRPRGV